jgi:hypothetical protein
MQFEYRLVRHTDDNGDPYLCVHEVLYDDERNIIDMSEGGLFAGNTMQDIALEIGRIVSALTEPVIDDEDISNHGKATN